MAYMQASYMSINTANILTMLAVMSLFTKLGFKVLPMILPNPFYWLEQIPLQTVLFYLEFPKMLGSSSFQGSHVAPPSLRQMFRSSNGSSIESTPVVT